ncbi:MAG: oligosaccharide flippase family protein [Nitrospirae bacterium]|nr:oligosaccharide flippase family protein [Nitrospirota bacterium]
MNLARESFYTFMFQVSGFLFATVTGMIVARALGPANKGILTVALLCPSLFFTAFNLSIGLGIIHHMGKGRYEMKTFAGSALALFAVITIIALVAFFVTIIYFREVLYRGIDLRYLIVAGIAIPFNLMLYYFSSILQGSMEIKGYNITNQLLSYSNLFFVLLFLFLSKLTAMEAVIAGISGIVIGGTVALLKATKMAGGISFNAELTKRLIKDGGKIQIGAIATFLYTQANVFILNYYAPPAEVGFYSVALNVANMLLFFSVSLEIGLYPKMAHASMEEAVSLVQVATRQILLISALAGLIVAVFSTGIVRIYGGNAFMPAVTPLLLLLPGVVIFIIPKILATLWVRKGWFFPLTLIASITALLSICFNFLLIPKYGANGAAIATTLTYALSAFVGLFLFRKFVDKDLTLLLIPSRKDLSMYREIYRESIQKFI